jgi:hypothetical protein
MSPYSKPQSKFEVQSEAASMYGPSSGFAGGSHFCATHTTCTAAGKPNRIDVVDCIHRLEVRPLPWVLQAHNNAVLGLSRSSNLPRFSSQHIFASVW